MADWVDAFDFSSDGAVSAADLAALVSGCTYQAPVEVFADLPADDLDGTVRVVMGTCETYVKEGAVWLLMAGSPDG